MRCFPYLAIHSPMKHTIFLCLPKLSTECLARNSWPIVNKLVWKEWCWIRFDDAMHSPGNLLLACLPSPPPLSLPPSPYPSLPFSFSSLAPLRFWTSLLSSHFSNAPLLPFPFLPTKPQKRGKLLATEIPSEWWLHMHHHYQWSPGIVPSTLTVYTTTLSNRWGMRATTAYQRWVAGWSLTPSHYHSTLHYTYYIPLHSTKQSSCPTRYIPLGSSEKRKEQ